MYKQSKDWVRCCPERSGQGHVQFLKNNNNSVKAEEKRGCVLNEQDLTTRRVLNTIFIKSLILAQDERWRRA